MNKRELLLLRHGKSDWSQRLEDFQRPLKKRGRRGAKAIGAWLREQGLVPDLIVSSPALRAHDTARLAAAKMDRDEERILLDERIYLADTNTLLKVLADCPRAAARIMLVGHNPGLEDLLGYLAGEAIPLPEDGKLLPTATLARLRMPADWHRLAPACAELLSITRPDAVG